MKIRSHGRFSFLKALALLVLLGILIPSMASPVDALPLGAGEDPLAIIEPGSSSYPNNFPPTFAIQTGSHRYYKVELALADDIFAMADGSQYKISQGEARNFDSSGWLQSNQGLASFTLDGTVWTNLRASLVFYRLLTNSSQSNSGALTSDIDSLERTAEGWIGFPLNDRVKVFDSVQKEDIFVVLNGQLQGRALESDFGPRDADGSRFHGGLDIPVAIGTPVYAIADGRVSLIPGAGSTAHRVNIRHSNGEYSGYVHLDAWLVAAGEDVKAGQLVGYSGDWVGGEHKAAHLHFEAGFTDRRPFINPLGRLPHTDTHTLASDKQTFLGDAQTHNNEIDVVYAAGSQEKLLVGFGITTNLDKDLNYVSVQIDQSTSEGQYFELDYDRVSKQDSSTGLVTIGDKEDETFFLIHRSGYAIYPDANYAKTCADAGIRCGLHVVPAKTKVGEVAKDNFYFPWDITPFSNQDDGGAHTIQLILKEVDGFVLTRSMIIGAEISVNSPTINGKQMAFELDVVNHDTQQGEISLAVKDLPQGWTASLESDIPFIPANGSEKISLTLIAPDNASMAPLCNANTRVIGTFLRIQAFKDTAELCPKVRIDSPTDGTQVYMGDPLSIVVKTKPDLTATSVRLEIDGASVQMTGSESNTTWSYDWLVPTYGENSKTVQLRAFAIFQVVSEEVASQPISVNASKRTETKIVVILIPDDGQEVKPGENVPIEIFADLGVTGVQLMIDNQSQALTKVGDTKYTTNWIVPSTASEGTIFELRATGKYGDKPLQSVVMIEVVIDQKEPVDVSFEDPKDGDTLPIAQPRSVIVLAADTAQVDVASVVLDISPADGDAGGWMTELGAGRWKYDWKPKPVGGIERQTYSLVASAYDINNLKVGEKLIQVFAEGVNPTEPWIEGPLVVFVNAQATHTFKAPQANRVVLKRNGSTVCDLYAQECTYRWVAASERKYTLLGQATYEGGATKSVSIEVEARAAPAMRITSINKYAFLAEIDGLNLDAPLHNGSYVPLPIPANNYACGIAGYEARGGDIGESIDYFYDWVPDLTGVFLRKAWSGNYELMADFNTIYRHWLFSYDGDRPEVWNIDILCVSREVASIHASWGLGDNANRNTGISISDKVCGIGGFWAHGGDIQENDAGDIMQMYLYRQGGVWNIRADFRTHEGDRGKENWDVDLLCLNSTVASLDGPVPDLNKLFFLREYHNLGDNIGSSRMVNTGYSVDDYVCGVAGFAARDGDIDEGNFQGGNAGLLLAYMYPRNGTWHIRADFRTHNNNENWDVNILCALRDGRAPVPWNISREDKGIENCMGEGMKCQVLKDEAVSLSGSVVIKGGGYSGSPSQTGHRCSNLSAIEVYVNDRDPGTGKPRWTWPNYCLRDGNRFYLVPGNTYDFRGVSIVGGTTKSFELVDPYSPPVLRTAVKTLFPASYGPGIALTWTPTLHPQAAFYEIQFMKEGETDWQVYTTNRDISHGGWINHHGSANCGHGFQYCLDRVKQYSYRVRVLNAAKAPITDWSNILSTWSMDWPANVELADPVPPDPYPAYGWTEVALEVKNTYGEGLTLEWQFQTWSGAQYQIVRGCQKGGLGLWDATHCVIRVSKGGSASLPIGGLKLAKLEPPASVDVIVSGKDALGYSDIARVSLDFRREDNNEHEK